jgi:hypothetical protein
MSRDVFQKIPGIFLPNEVASLELKDGKGDIPSVGEAEGALSALYHVADTLMIQDNKLRLIMKLNITLLNLEIFFCIQFLLFPI